MTSALGLHARRDSLGGDDEEFDEADMWGGDEGPREEDDASRSSSDDEQEEQEAAAVAQEDGFSSAMRRFEVLQPATSNPIVGSLPNWTSSMPRAIIHPKAAAVAAATAAAAAAAAAAAGAGTDGVPGDAGGVVGGLGLMNNKMDGSDIATMAASFPDPGPGFIPPHIYAASYSMYSSTAGGGFMDAFLSGNGQGIQGGGIGSCVSGRGHTLKGRDAIKMRTAILRQTGFVEPNTPGGLLDMEPRTSTPAILPRVSTPAIVVAGDVAGRETSFGFDDDARSP